MVAVDRQRSLERHMGLHSALARGRQRSVLQTSARQTPDAHEVLIRCYEFEPFIAA
jgi:hypothetical protein